MIILLADPAFTEHLPDDGTIIKVKGIKAGVRIAVYITQKTVFGIKHKNTSTPMIPRHRAEGNKKGGKQTMYEGEQKALAERLKGMEPGTKRDNVLLLAGFAAGIEAREETTEAETKPA